MRKQYERRQITIENAQRDFPKIVVQAMQLSLIPDEINMEKVQKHLNIGEILQRDKDIRKFIATSGGKIKTHDA